jgi:hypothetical protein
MASKPKIDFTPVPVRRRHDGWTPERQAQFLEALAQCGCVDEACARVGMGRSSAYELRARMDAESFRAGWSAALDHGIGRIEDAAFSRAINGVTRPVFYKGEKIGEKTYYDERLVMFLLRYRDPARYGRWRDRTRPAIAPDGIARQLWEYIDRTEHDAWDDLQGFPRANRPPPAAMPPVVSEAELEAERRRQKRR